MTMAHVLEAWLHLLGTEPAALPAAREALRRGRALPATEREASTWRPPARWRRATGTRPAACSRT